VDAQSPAGSTPLIEAAWWGHTAVAELCLQRGANPRHASESRGSTALHAAAIKGHADMVRLLLRQGADPEVKDSRGARPLDEALRYKHGAAVAALLESGGGQKDLTEVLELLHNAVLRGQAETVRILLRQIPDPGVRLPNGSTLLHEAALNGQVEIVELLLAGGADARVISASGATPLHDAAAGGHARIAELLLAKGAEVNARDSELGNTPLHQAASWGRLDLVRLLLARNADVHVKNARGLLPADAAAENGHQPAAELIRRTYAANQTP
jgi:cytohesin